MPGGVAGVSRWIWRCGLMHMKGESILFNLSNHNIHIHILRYVFSYLTGYKDTYPKIRIDMIHIQNFSYAERALPAFICTNPHLHIFPKTPGRSVSAPQGAHPSGLSWRELQKISHMLRYMNNNYRIVVPLHPSDQPQPTVLMKCELRARARAKTPISRTRPVIGFGVVVGLCKLQPSYPIR